MKVFGIYLAIIYAATMFGLWQKSVPAGLAMLGFLMFIYVLIDCYLN